MSASDEWSDWHLTPQGWVEGTQKLDFAGLREKPTPADRELTCRYSEQRSSPYSKWRKGADIIWQSQNEEEIKKLIQIHGECPQVI